MHHPIRKVIGIILILLGIASVPIPIIPGSLLIIPGILMLGNHHVCMAFSSFRKKISRLLGHRAARAIFPPKILYSSLRDDKGLLKK